MPAQSCLVTTLCCFLFQSLTEASISTASYQLDCHLHTVCGFLPDSDDNLSPVIALILELHKHLDVNHSDICYHHIMDGLCVCVSVCLSVCHPVAPVLHGCSPRPQRLTPRILGMRPPTSPHFCPCCSQCGGGGWGELQAGHQLYSPVKVSSSPLAISTGEHNRYGWPSTRFPPTTLRKKIKSVTILGSENVVNWLITS